MFSSKSINEQNTQQHQVFWNILFFLNFTTHQACQSQLEPYKITGIKGQTVPKIALYATNSGQYK